MKHGVLIFAAACLLGALALQADAPFDYSGRTTAVVNAPSEATGSNAAAIAALHYSSISAWEIARLQKEGKVVIPNDPAGFMADLTELYGLAAIPPVDDIMLRAAQLPDFHKDPADRIIIATALIHDLPIVTGDGKFPQYGVKTIC